MSNAMELFIGFTTGVILVIAGAWLLVYGITGKMHGACITAGLMSVNAGIAYALRNNGLTRR